MKRPSVASANSHAVDAVIMGLRGKATAMAVPSPSRSVTSPAAAADR